jgi:hypothetical protein
VPGQDYLGKSVGDSVSTQAPTQIRVPFTGF